jgi:hypothetical protein
MDQKTSTPIPAFEPLANARLDALHDEHSEQTYSSTCLDMIFNAWIGHLTGNISHVRPGSYALEI